METKLGTETVGVNYVRSRFAGTYAHLRIYSVAALSQFSNDDRTSQTVSGSIQLGNFLGLLALIFVKLSRILFLAFAVTTVVSFAFATFAESVASDEPGLAADTQPPAPLTGPWQVIRGKIARPGEFSRMYKGDTTPLPDPWHRRKKAEQSNSEIL